MRATKPPSTRREVSRCRTGAARPACLRVRKGRAIQKSPAAAAVNKSARSHLMTFLHGVGWSLIGRRRPIGRLERRGSYVRTILARRFIARSHKASGGTPVSVGAQATRRSRAAWRLPAIASPRLAAGPSLIARKRFCAKELPKASEARRRRSWPNPANNPSSSSSGN